MPEFYIMFAGKIFFGGGSKDPLVSYACGWAPGPHQLNPALCGTNLMNALCNMSQ